MRDIRTRRLAWAALPVAGVLLLAGCGDDDDKKDDAKTSPSASAPATTAPATSAAPTSAAPTSSAPASAPAAAANPATFSADQKGAADAYTKLFDPATPVDQRKALIQDADKLTTLIDTLLASPMASQVKFQVKDVKVEGDKATVTYDVLLGANPVVQNQPGPAVKQGGAWKVGAKTVCGMASYVGATAPAECASYQ